MEIQLNQCSTCDVCNSGPVTPTYEPVDFYSVLQDNDRSGGVVGDLFPVMAFNWPVSWGSTSLVGKCHKIVPPANPYSNPTAPWVLQEAGDVELIRLGENVQFAFGGNPNLSRKLVSANAIAIWRVKTHRGGPSPANYEPDTTKYAGDGFFMSPLADGGAVGPGTSTAHLTNTKWYTGIKVLTPNGEDWLHFPSMPTAVMPIRFGTTDHKDKWRAFIGFRRSSQIPSGSDLWGDNPAPSKMIGKPPAAVEVASVTSEKYYGYSTTVESNSYNLGLCTYPHGATPEGPNGSGGEVPPRNYEWYAYSSNRSSSSNAIARIFFKTFNYRPALFKPGEVTAFTGPSWTVGDYSFPLVVDNYPLSTSNTGQQFYVVGCYNFDWKYEYNINSPDSSINDPNQSGKDESGWRYLDTNSGNLGPESGQGGNWGYCETWRNANYSDIYGLVAGFYPYLPSRLYLNIMDNNESWTNDSYYP
jgi:hypothetical protein